MPIARIEDNTIVEQRNADLTSVPEHKRSRWREIVGTRPEVDSAYYTVTGPIYEIGSEHVTRIWTVAPRELATVKAELKQQISGAAEARRALHLTLLPGKTLSYEKLAQEAAAFLMSGQQEGVTYPYLQSRVDSGRYANLAAAAAGTQAIQQQMAIRGSAIDAVEDRAKLGIDAATTVEAAYAAAQVTWPE